MSHVCSLKHIAQAVGTKECRHMTFAHFLGLYLFLIKNRFSSVVKKKKKLNAQEFIIF